MNLFIISDDVGVILAVVEGESLSRAQEIARILTCGNRRETFLHSGAFAESSAIPTVGMSISMRGCVSGEGHR